MRDKLTKKRVKVDYLLVLKCAGVELDFLKWQRMRQSKVGFNRQAYAFCKMKHIDVDQIYSDCLSRGIATFEDYEKECIRLAKDHSWIFDD